MKHDAKIGQILLKYRYPLLILLLGVFLMLLPGGKSSARKEAEADSGETRLQELLAASEGVGDARVLISDSGVVVVCSGAENAQVRLNILRAVASYTGFGSDKITILKLAGS